MINKSSNPFVLMVFLLICILSFHLSDGKYTIHSSPVSLGFDQYNVIKEIKIRFMAQSIINKKDVFMVSFSSSIQRVPSALGYSLIDEFKKQLARGSLNYITDATISSLSLQYFKNGAGSSYTGVLQDSTWYLNSENINSQWLTLVIRVPQDLTNTFAQNMGSVSMGIISSLDVQHIRYQWTNSMSYFYYASLAAVAPPQLINVQIANNIYGKTGQSISQVPGSVYPVYLELTPTVNFNDFVLNLEFTSMSLVDLLALSSPSLIKDFQFQGTCYFICQSSVTCVNAQYCTVNSDKIQVKIAQLIGGQKYVLRLSVLNPPYQATKNIMLWVDSNGTSQDMANIVGQLQTQPITITSQEMKLFWKIPYSIVTTNMGLGIFVNGGINTVQVGFQINTNSPFGQVLEFSVYIGSTQLIMQSISHNLPSLNTTISYEFVSPNLIIKNVTALTRTNYRYWIAFRTRYTSTDNLNPIGSLTINLQKYPSKLLFNPLVVNTPKTKILFSDFHDTAGFHSSSFKNYDTQIISSIDNMLQNATSEAIRKYFNQPTTVGVDPSTTNQQLLFLMNVPQAKIYLGTVGQKYDTKIFFNPNIFQSVSDKGLSLVAYNGATTKWDNFGNDCYVNQVPSNYTTQTYMCQKYDDHVFDQQFDNVLITQPYFKYYQHTCGNGIKVECKDATSCKQQCTLFKGYALSHGKAGIVAMRNVNFIPNYQSPIQASDKNLDFIVSFYHNGAFVSATLINGYTIKSQPLKRTQLSFINTYHDGVKYNLGDRIPTLIKISGRLELSQFINLQYPSKIKLYFPSTKTAFNSFLSNINQIGCSYYCRFNESKSLAVTQNWMQWHTVSIENMPQLTNDFNILVPIQLKTTLMSVYLSFESSGKTVAVYRFGGSAVNQSISLPVTNLFTTQTFTSPWDLISDWVIGSSFSYLQKINLQQTNSYNNFTLITMSDSIMPAFTKPYVTFSAQNIQILATYTDVIVGNSLQNRSCQKLTYFYNMKRIQCLICQMYGNDNTTNNNIRMEYPLYNNDLGPGYPYDKLFNFGYSSDGVDGQLQGIKRETGDKVIINSCRTNKATEYNVGQVGRQLQIYRIQIDPILLSSSTYTKLQLIFEIPSNIQPVQCSIVDVIFYSKISCAVLSQVGNVTTLQLSISGFVEVKLLQFYVYLYCYQIPTVSLSVGQLYKLKIRYPHTMGGLQTIYGSSFSPYFSTVYQCENSFTYINAGYNNSIIINSHKLNAVGLKMNSQLQFNITLSKQKSHLLKNSYVQFQFNSLEVTDLTYCEMVSFKHKFSTRTYTANSYKLYTNVDIDKFTDNPIMVKCSNLLLQGMNPTLIVRVFDVTANLVIMLSANGVPYPLTTSPYFNNPTPVLSTGTLLSKQYTTLGFNSHYTLTYSISGLGSVEGFIDFSEYSIDYRLLRCELSIPQDVFCRLHQLNTNATLQSRSRFVYFKTYFASSFTSVTLSVYPVLQQKKVTAPKLNTLIRLNSNDLFYVPITDSLPTIPVDDVFLITSFNVTPSVNSTIVKFSLDITYIFAVTIARPIYLQLNEIFFYNSILGVSLKCTINSLNIVPCVAVEKDLIKIDTSSFTHTADVSYTLRIESFDANYQISLRDRENFFFRMFIIDPATKQIDYVSYMNTDLAQATKIMTLIKSYQNMFGKSYLVWNTTDPVTQSTFVPIIYVGYYGKPIELIQFNSNKFSQDFLLSSPDYTLNNFNCEMGLNKCPISILAQDFSTVTKTFYFTHFSTVYTQPPPLIVEVSNQKCIINLQFTNYKIFQNGITLPIVLNFSHCKPRYTLSVVPTLNSSEVYIDQSLSQLEISNTNPIGIIFVRHSSVDVSLKSYLMSLTLSGTYASSFVIGSTVVIDKIVRTQTNIMAKSPQTLSLLSSELRVRIQCSQPSTVYWAIGFYPTTLGIKGQDIQTRLLNGQIGLWTSITDYFTFGNLEYGLTYTEVPNVWKELVIDQLVGNTMYSFKYFCVNIKGTFSDGKILTFTTPPSNYSMIKLQLGFTSPLTYGKVNDFACAISQSLIIPYRQTITSVNSNCKNASLIFFDTFNDTMWNYKLGQNPQNFYYNFYIESYTLKTINITSTIRDLLRKNPRIMNSQLPIWKDFNIQQIDPNVITPQFSADISTKVDQTLIQMTFPISDQLSYVIVGLLSSYFDESSMSLPANYMIKQGKFSESVDFDRVFMNYTTNNITFAFDGLNADTQYSIFYFVTVDDPSINSKHSQVKYINLVTAPYLQVDLFSPLMKNAIFWTFVLSLILLFLA